MLDTNMVSDLLKFPAGAVARRIGAADAAISISIIVAAELRYGAAKRASARLSAPVDSLLAVIDIEPLATPADTIYGRLRADLERGGEPMSANDLLIAAHALALDRTLVSHDAAFARVPDLKLEDWLAA
jgi:tRNA(fMet)-specific endonuclease VapC